MVGIHQRMLRKDAPRRSPGEALSLQTYMETPMAKNAKKLQALQIADRRRRVAGMCLQGHKQADIAAAVGVDMSTVSRDLKAIEEQWTRSALLDLHAAKVKELARIDAIEREAWEAWRRSQKSAERVRVEDGPLGAKRSKEVKGRDGTAEFLRAVQWCVEQRIRILGLERLSEQGESASVTALLNSLRDLRDLAQSATGFAAEETP